MDGYKLLPFVDLGQANERLLKRIFSGYKSSAKRRGLDFKLEFPDFGELVLQNCAFCGAEPSNERNDKRRGESQKYNGLDRLDSNRGYELDNVVPCCQFCNTLKASMPFEDWADFLNGVVDLHGGEKPFPEVTSPNRPTKSFYFNRRRRRRK